MGLIVDILNETVEKELDALPVDLKARFIRVVVVRAFVKKTEKTPGRKIRLALERAKEV